MLTRRRKSDRGKEKDQANRVVCLRFPVRRCLNPTTDYQPYHVKIEWLSQNVCFSEQMLRNLNENTSYLGPIFCYNRIVRSYRQFDYVVFNLVQSNHCPMSLPYIVQRFKSFGDSTFFQVADSLEKIIKEDAQLYTRQEINLFKTPEQIAQEYSHTSCMIITGDFTSTGLVSNKIFLSERLIKDMGYNAEEIMMSAAQFGKLEMGAPGSMEFVTSNCSDHLLSYLNSQIAFKKLIRDRNLGKINEVIDEFTIKGRLRIIGQNHEAYDLNCIVKSVTPTTFMVIFEDFQGGRCSVPSSTAESEEREQFYVDTMDEEYEVMQHLTFIPENYLKSNRSYVCGFRETSLH